MRKSYKNDTDSLDVLFGMLANHRRRCALHCLERFEGALALADLAEEVAVRENETPISEISPEEVKRIYMSLYHTHIPKMEEANVVHYSQETDIVALSENSEQLGPYLQDVYN